MQSKTETLSGKLDALLALSAEDLRQRLQQQWSGLPNNKAFVLFGAGKLGQFVAQALKQQGISVVAYADDTPHLQGKQVQGVDVLSLDQAKQQFSDQAIFVVCIMSEHHRYTDSYNRLNALGISNVISFQQLAYQYPDDLLPWYQFDVPNKILLQQQQWKTVFSLLEDETSQHHFIRLLENRLLIELEHLPTVEQLYFPSDLFDSSKINHYVDCGAFDGDTLQLFMSHNPEFSNAVVFEPDPQNFIKLQQRVNNYPSSLRSKIDIRYQAISNQPGKARFHSAAGAASLLSDDGDVDVDVINLDTALAGQKVDYIKFDIEGAEMDALHGAKNLIASQQPILAISSYHLPDDILRIPTWLKNNYPNCNIAFRLEGTDGLGGVVYAVPE